jgi:hypothetical protein
MLPAALLVVGAGMKMYSDYTGNVAQANAEIQNAKFYDTQGRYALEAMSREATLSRRKYSAGLGAQITSFAKSGVSLGQGSSLGVVANTIAQQVEELHSIRRKGDIESSLAFGRAAQARDVAGRLKDPMYNILQASGTALTAYAMGK